MEGPTDDPAVRRLRERLVKNFVCCLLFSSGTPMLLAGDECLRTQEGNNNAYCQDNRIGWFDWSQVTGNIHTVEFFRKAIALTNRYTILQRRRFYLGVDLDANAIPDLSWFSPEGGSPEWTNPESRTLCVMLDGSEEKSPLGDYQLFIVLHAGFHLRKVRLPRLHRRKKWYRVLDTGLPAGDDLVEPGKEVLLDPPDAYLVNPRSTVLLLAMDRFETPDAISRMRPPDASPAGDPLA